MSHPLPPLPTSSPPSGGVRRHHTISASSRTARANAREDISEEAQDQQLGIDDEVVDDDWVGGVGAVGEKSSLHRQSSLPTRYRQAYHGPASKSGNITPKPSLTAIAGHEGDEEEWESASMRGLRDEDQQHAVVNQQQQQVMDLHTQQSNNSPLSPHFAPPPHVPSPPPAGSGVRRHQSLNYAGGGPRQMPPSAGLKRSGTLQGSHKQPAQTRQTPSPPEDEEEEDVGEDYYEDPYYPPTQQQPAPGQGQYPGSRGSSSPWNANQEWRGSDNSTIDDALSNLQIGSNANAMYRNLTEFPPGQSIHPPRFNPNQPPPTQAPGLRNNNNNHNTGNGTSADLRLKTDFSGRKTPLASGHPVSAAPYVPPIGHSVGQQPPHHHLPQRSMTNDERSSSGSASWDQQQDKVIVPRTSNSNLQYLLQQQAKAAGIIPNVPSIPRQYIQSQQQQQQIGASGLTVATPQVQGSNQAFANSPIDVPSLIATKGYNPINFDVRPQFARFFVIKSYTEDDVHKSLKYEIWSSTDPGNKRLDKAFKETAGRGPIYLFFSVNASGHFCGMAEMLTPVDYTRSSTVWASDKWKGVFKVRWIFVRDIPNVNLRHIKLNNTQERKPVTNSRDTQELLPDAGQEMLRIFHTHPARTSLLQDFAFYELQAIQKVQAQGTPSSPTQSPVHSPQPQPLSPSTQHQQNSPFSMVNMNPNALAYQMPQLTPMMQMQLQMNMGMGSQFGIPQAQAMHQSVLRHPSPGPTGTLPVDGQSFMGMPGF